MKENVKRALVSKGVDKARLAELAVRFTMAVMLGSVRILGGFSPFGAAFVGAAPGGGPGVVTLIGACLGAMTLGSFVTSVKYIAIAVLVWATLHFFADVCPDWFPMAVAFGAMSVVGAVFAWDTGWEIRATALWVVEAFMAGGFVYFYSSALSPIDGALRPEVRAAHTASVVILAASLLMSLAPLELFGVLSVGRCAAVILVLFVTLRGGMAMGCVAGAVLGAAMDLAQGGVPFFTMSYAFSAVIAGIFSKSGRLPFMLGYFAASSLSVLWYWGAHRWMMSLYETFAALVIFALLPEEWLTKAAVFLPVSVQGFGFLKAREYTRDRVELCAQAFKKLYETVREGAGDTNVDNTAVIFDRAADAVCRSCPRSQRCWQESYVDTVDVMNSLEPMIASRGEVEVSDLAEHFRQRCEHPQALVSAINAEARTLLTRRQYRARLRESRTAAIEQYDHIAGLLRSMARELGGEITVEPALERRLQKYLRGIAVDASVAVFRVRGGRLRAEISSSNLRLLKRDELWLDKLSQVLGVRLCTGEGSADSGRLVVLEAEPLAVRVGEANAKKSGETVSGDRSACFRTDEGDLYVILSDGMGSGPEAARMSGAALNILERFLRAGVRPELALPILSDLCLTGVDGELMGATVDLLCLNMFTGEAAVYKCGAAPSYVKRGSSVKRVAAPDPRRGVKRAGTKLSLSPGSVAVMVSDGVTSGPDDRWLREAIGAFDGQDLTELSRGLIAQAQKRVGGEDDMTVIAVSCEERG